MSSRGRKRAEVAKRPTLLAEGEGVAAAPEKHPEEFFETPSWCVDRILKANELRGGCWLEPTAGTGAIIRAVNARRSDVLWDAVELRPDAHDVLCQSLADHNGQGSVWISDFLRWGMREQVGTFDVAIGNPPFTLAAPIISHSLTMASRVLFLLRLAFLESEERIPFFKRVGVPDIYTFPDRPSFVGSGSTDSAAYAWMEFRPEWAGRRESRHIALWPDDAVNQLTLGGIA